MTSILHITADRPHFPHGPFHHHEPVPPVVLPPAVAELKERIRKTRPKYFHFSLADMHKVSTPPVKIPPEYRFTRATTTFVGGREVPFTRVMWMRRQQQRPMTLDAIDEGDERRL